MLRISFKLCLTLLIAALAAAQAQTAPREVTALVGAGQDTFAVNVFFPQILRVRAGDTVTWKLNTDEIHTVSFVRGTPAEEQLFGVPLPGGAAGELMVNPRVAFPTRMPGAPVETYSGEGFVSSGILSNEAPAPDAPPNDTFALTFDTPGTYTYICLVHEEYMTGTVVVEEATATDVPSPEEVLAEAEAEIAPLLAGLEAAKVVGQAALSEPGPNDTTLWYVKAGILDIVTADPRGEVLEFLPQNLTVKAGDTVVWGSPGFHTVSFSPLPPPPEFILSQPQEAGPPLLVLNPEVLMSAKPAAVYDPLQYFNSGIIGLFTPSGTSWALTFEEPGTYEYVCLVHAALGMKGTITVLPR